MLSYASNAKRKEMTLGEIEDLSLADARIKAALQMKPAAVTGRDIRQVLRSMADSNRPAIANGALMYCKQMFNHVIKLDIVSSNPAFAFKKFREESDSFT